MTFQTTLLQEIRGEYSNGIEVIVGVHESEIGEENFVNEVKEEIGKKPYAYMGYDQLDFDGGTVICVKSDTEEYCMWASDNYLVALFFNEEFSGGQELKESAGDLIDAYAVGSRVPEKVVHYVPTHRGTTNGQRIFFDDVMYISKNRSQMGPETASRYLLTVASLAGQILGKDYFTQDYIRRLKGKKLRRKARRLVIDNIIKPYRYAMDEQ